jgi:hypothetical protein
MSAPAIVQRLARSARIFGARLRRSAAGGLRDSGVAAQGLLRGLGLIYVLSFWSIAAQIQALCGPGGLSPVHEVLARASTAYGNAAFWRLPTLLWLRPDNIGLITLSALGALAGLSLLAGRLPWWSALCAWICQISLVNACPEWLASAGDLLLCETGFWALFLARPRWSALPAPEAMADRRAGLFFCRLLLFRVLLGSGLAKLADPLWRKGSVLFFYFETQPLPTVGGWFFHFLPEPVLTYALWGVMFVELALPFYIFLPRLFRNIAAGGFALHALLSLLAGNPGPLPPLLLLLAFALVDDRSWRILLPAGWGPAAPLRSSKKTSPVWPWLLMFLPVALLGFHAPSPWRQVADWLDLLRAVNRYETPVVVPERRLEIALQASADGKEWREFRFKQKASDPRLLPSLTLPHYPRLDVKMVDAAQPTRPGQPPPSQDWLYRFAQGVLEGNTLYTSLLADNPFAARPPRFLRLVVYEYQFADPATRRREKNWWRRTWRGLYAPVLQREPTRSP